MISSELGIATHYVPSHRIPALTERLAALEDASFDAINATIEEHVADLSPGDVRNHLVGPVRTAVDKVFRQNNITKMIKELNRATQALDENVRVWGKATLETLSQRSPTSLKVALKAIRKGQAMKLSEALQMELGIATAFCVRP
jgi:3-hydroxyisobutyryl-CoA hydrolase